ncbi:ATP-sensitive inward rectifier potassium channel 10 [Myxococcota bacterium]|nr:ATP-sensitive inward rectifier potassium channel 10 [Myxococcota bacterium]
MSWTRLFGLAVVIYAALNVGFAGLYLLGGDCISNAEPGSFVDALSFSVQTLATIGYGVMAPTTVYAHLLVAIEALCGVLSFAMITGIVFAKFSRPTARVLFSDVACVGSHDGRRVLMFRMANERSGSRVVEARVRVTLTKDETTSEGVFMRRFHDLGLVREWTPIFALTWTAMHVIDETSPLFGLDPESLHRVQAEIVVSFSGLDEHLSQPVHARHSYVATEIRFDARFADVMSFDDDGSRVFDLDRFHQTLPA